jgi:glycosyltransferase involved in cell wall biosynthesis
MSLKILYLVPHLGKGGAEELIVRLATDLSKKNNVNLVLFFNLVEASYNTSRLPKEVNVSYLFNKKINYLSKERHLYTALSYLLSPLFAMYLYFKNKFFLYDVVHVNLTLPSFYLAFFKPLKKILFRNEVYVQTFHTNLHLLKGISRFLNVFSWKFSDSFVYEIFKEEGEKFKEYINEEKIEYIPFGYCSKIDNKNLNSHLTHDIDIYIPSGHKVFMTISRVRFFEKKIDVMIRAMSYYKKINDKFIFIIAGNGEDLSKAKSLACDLGLSDHVKFLGYVDNPEQLAKIADVFLVAVVGKSTGVSGMQAIANQKVVIGVQTVQSYDDADEGLLTAAYPHEVAAILHSLDDNALCRDYKTTMVEIANENCENELQFSARYKSLYSKLLETR